MNEQLEPGEWMDDDGTVWMLNYICIDLIRDDNAQHIFPHDPRFLLAARAAVAKAEETEREREQSPLIVPALVARYEMVTLPDGTRRVDLTGSWQIVETAGLMLRPTPTCLAAHGIGEK